MVVTDGGLVWQWSAAIPSLSELPGGAASTQLLPKHSPASALLKPKLIGARVRSWRVADPEGESWIATLDPKACHRGWTFVHRPPPRANALEVSESGASML